MIRIELDTPNGIRKLNYDGVNLQIDSEMFNFMSILEQIFNLIILNMKNGEAMEFLKLEEKAEEDKKKDD